MAISKIITEKYNQLKRLYGDADFPTIISIFSFILLLSSSIIEMVIELSILFRSYQITIILFVFLLIIRFIYQIAEYKMKNASLQMRNNKMKNLSLHAIEEPYDKLISKEYQELYQEAYTSVSTNRVGFESICSNVTKYYSCIFTIISICIFLVCSNILVGLCSLIFSILTIYFAWLHKNKLYEYYSEILEIQMKNNLVNDITMNKDYIAKMKTINNKSLYSKLENNLIQSSKKIIWSKLKKNLKYNLCMCGIFAIYGFSLYLLLNNHIVLSMILCINLIKTSNELFAYYESYELSIYYIDRYYEFMNSKKEETSHMNFSNDYIQSIEFKHVSFSYGDKEVIHDISFRVEAPCNIGIIGENGAGKSTIINLLTKMYKPTKGKVLINDIDIWSNDYFPSLSVLYQDKCIFPFSIRDNILLNKSFNESYYNDLIENIGLSKKIHKLAYKDYTNAVIGIDGNETDFSGGESQRLQCARVLYQKNNLNIFDEATSEMDASGEKMFYSAITKTLKKSINIFITHRMSSLQFTDKIIIIGNGVISNIGEYDSLIKEHNYLRKVFDNQRSIYDEEFD